MNPQNLKIALLHDWFFNLRGANRQFKYISEIFPNADIFFLFSNQKLAKKTFGPKRKIFNSVLNFLPFRQKIYPAMMVLAPLIIELLNFSKYDIVISSTTNFCKGINTPKNTLHVSYLYSASKYLWDLEPLYFGKKSGLHPVIRFLISPLIFFLKKWDFMASKKPDYLISISDYVNSTIKKFYKRKADLIYPGVEVSSIKTKYKNLAKYFQKKKFYLHITSFEANKNTELVINTFRNFSRNLIIIGAEGRFTKKLLKKLPKNIKFLGWVTEEKKYKLVSDAKAVIISGIEDFGIVPIEAASLKTPTIGYNKGGIKEVVKPRFLFNKNTVQSLRNKIIEMEKTSKKKDFLNKPISYYDVRRFKKEFRDFVLKKYKTFYANRN